jgi:hypothetical protein
MSILSQFAFQSNQVRVLVLGDEPWFVASDVAKVLEYVKVDKMLQLVDEEDKQVINPQKLEVAKIAESFNSNSFKVSIINESGLKKILVRSTKSTAISLANDLGMHIVYPRKRSEYIHVLVLAFEDLYPIPEFSVHGYKIDLYLSKVNIAIECDEYNHVNYSESNEIKREAIIKNALGCSFVRFNPDAKKFNIGSVIKQIRDLV